MVWQSLGNQQIRAARLLGLAALYQLVIDRRAIFLGSYGPGGQLGSSLTPYGFTRKSMLGLSVRGGGLGKQNLRSASEV